MKVCSKCHLQKPSCDFLKHKTSSDGLGSYCKSCRKIYNAKYLKKNREKLIKKSKDYYEENKSKHLEKCKNYRELNQDKVRTNKRKYYTNNRHRIKDYVSKWKKENASHTSEYMKKYKDNNRDRLNKKRNHRLQHDEVYRILHNLRSRLHSALNSQGIKKETRTLDLIGCSAKECKAYIESLWKESMTWNNYGVKGWHIDHIDPCSSFDLSKEEEQRQCFHYTNLQPLWWQDNLHKGAKRAK